MSADVEAVLDLLDGASPLNDLEARAPGIGAALEGLHRAGLVAYEGGPTRDEP
ncbi:MAG: hypothetical protein H6828_01020 [Planctomycetes bacterium]|nr:hypothetical protein [Planctomycetota bacterium]